MTIAQEVKAHVDIVEVASEYTRLTKAGRLLSGLCPLHSEKHPSFFVYPEEQRWHCFGGCNTGGDVISLVMKKEGLDFGEALRLLAQRAGIDIDSLAGRAQETGAKERLLQVNQEAAQFFHQMLLSQVGIGARDYLRERGVDQKSIETFYLGYNPPQGTLLKHLLSQGFSAEDIFDAGLSTQTETGDKQDRFRGRLIFPIFDPQGRCVAFGGRALGDTVPKYINSSDSPLFKKGNLLYGLNLARDSIRKEGQVIVVEGYMDAIMAHQHNFTTVVAAMGTAITEAQIGELKRFTTNIVLALDADSAGEEGMLRCLDYEALTGREIKMLPLPAGKDPDDVIREDEGRWAELVEKAVPVMDFLFRKSLALLDSSSAQSKSLVAERLLPAIARIKDPIRESHYLQLLSQGLGVDEHRLELALAQYSRHTRGRPIQQASSISPTPMGSGRDIEGECLALLLRYPELRPRSKEVPLEYLESSEYREILAAIKDSTSQDIRDKLDSTLRGEVELLLTRPILEEDLARKLDYLLLRLHETYLRRLARERELILSQGPYLPNETDIAITQGLTATLQAKYHIYEGKTE